ncbi:MAG: aminoglycoside phosphotransferase family protein [Micropruina sp.]|uniref:aminoglycoside phosphotransferase family protein n=1 Tax=Micropruina sp. TaxID=2737536 RepID=UPI0039E502D6
MTSGWAPDPSWTPVGGAEGGATVGVWRTARSDGRWIVKRLRRTSTDDCRSFTWWRREIAVAESGIAAHFEGLIMPACRVEEDADGATLWSREVVSTAIPAEVAASALGRFASIKLTDPGWFTVGRLRDRVAIAADIGLDAVDAGTFEPGLWRLMEELWTSRDEALELLDRLPQVLSHGDALPRNLLRHDGATVTAIDWDQLGYAPVGADLASFGMWSSAPTETLIRRYLESNPADRWSEAQVRAGVALTTALIAISRVIRTTSTPGAGGYRDRLRGSQPQLEHAARLVRTR